MFTSNSKFVPEELKTKIMIYASAMRWIVELEQADKNTDFVAGRRFGDDEQVFQAFCQLFVDTKEQIDQVGNIDPDALPAMVEKALIEAGKCDHYYMYEKVW